MKNNRAFKSNHQMNNFVWHKEIEDVSVTISKMNLNGDDEV